MRVSRRWMLLAATVAFALPRRFAAAATPASPAGLRLRALARPAVSARAVGLAYLAGQPEEAHPLLLTELILAALALSPAEVMRLEDGALRARLAARIAADFAEDRIAPVEGWLLSATEARLYALQAWPPAAFGQA